MGLLYCKYDEDGLGKIGQHSVCYAVQMRVAQIDAIRDGFSVSRLILAMYSC